MTKTMIRKTLLVSLLFARGYAYAQGENLNSIQNVESIDVLIQDSVLSDPAVEALLGNPAIKVVGTIAATAANSGSFEIIRGNGFTIGTPVLVQPLIFGISWGMEIPIIFDTPFANIPTIITNYESGTTTLTGSSSPFYTIPAVDNPGPPVNQITGLNISNESTLGFTINIATFVNGVTFFPNVEAAIVQLSQYAFALNFLVLVI
jgi:hypothetical protein